jgi:hypothetical protein
MEILLSKELRKNAAKDGWSRPDNNDRTFPPAHVNAAGLVTGSKAPSMPAPPCAWKMK